MKHLSNILILLIVLLPITLLGQNSTDEEVYQAEGIYIVFMEEKSGEFTDKVQLVKM